MHAIAGTAHGDTDNPFTPWSNQGCESCHGPGSLHVSRARGGIRFPAMISFRDSSLEQQTQACLSCHSQDMGELEGFEWTGSIHDNGIVSCVSCHEVHTPDGSLGERPVQVEVCSACHASQISNHRRFEDVGIVFDELNCYNCHEVHEMIRER
ncbi:MAG TPA: multiheme c-type cytochrome [Gammaproteobacteria bacterium]|nr:multiheme c-type cytochrome [Gammaproteobacteria bacterium]